MNERKSLFLCVAISALAFGACKSNKVPEASPSAVPSSASPGSDVTVRATAPSAVSPHQAAPGAASDQATLEWTVPSTWTLGPARPMRKATYIVPATAGDSAPGELVVSFFGAGQGGDIEANVTRWVGQFKDVPEGSVVRSERPKDDLKVSLVEVPSGSYTNSMTGPQEYKEYALLGAIVEAPSGKYFFKLTGPKATVKASRDQFQALLDGLKQK
jgi:hypothetical protein